MEGFLYDTHIHTMETSKCGHVPANTQVERYLAKGYTGIMITDHLNLETTDAFGTTGDWQKTIDHHMLGYNAAKKHGEKLGLEVMLGAELRFPQNNNDYLLYGIDEDWLRSNPDIILMDAGSFFRKYHNEILIIQAHPYRDGNLEVYEDCIHGCELINGNPRHDNYPERALPLCQRHPEYIRLACSDAHQDGDDGQAGVILPYRVRTSREYKAVLESRDFHLWAPSFQSYVEADEILRKGSAA